MLTFVHISDTHVKGDGSAFHAVAPEDLLRQFVALINSWPQPPDFVLHTGDVVHDASADAYRRVRPILAELRFPLYLVCGNHDDRVLLRSVLDAPAAPNGDPNAPLDYVFSVRGERFVVLDGHSPLVEQPLGMLSAEQLAWLGTEATPDGPPLTVILHYPPFPLGSPWLDAHMILTNGEALHQALLPARGRLRGVFYGHLHRSSQVHRDGICYTCAPSLSSGFAWRPWDDDAAIDNFPPAYTVVRYAESMVVVHQYALSRG